MKIDLKECQFFMLGDGTGQEIEFKIGEGNLQWTEHMAREYTLDRGVLDTVRNADQQPLDLSFEFMWEWLIDHTGYESPYEALVNVGTTGGWTTTDDDECAPASIDIVIERTVICGTETRYEKITFPKFRYEQIQVDSKAGTLAISGKCNVLRPTIASTL